MEIIKTKFTDIYQFLGLKNRTGNQVITTKCLYFLSCLDLLSVSILPSTETELAIDTQSGRQKMTAEDYVKIIEHLQPSLAIQPFPEVTGYSQKKRTAKSVKHTTSFARNCLEIMKNKKNSNINICKLWPAISGGTDFNSWKISLNDFSVTYKQYEDLIGGVLLASFGQGETIEQRLEAVKLCNVSKINFTSRKKM